MRTLIVRLLPSSTASGTSIVAVHWSSSVTVTVAEAGDPMLYVVGLVVTPVNVAVTVSAMVARSGRLIEASPGPVNSTNLPTTPCVRSSSTTASVTSVAVVPGYRRPVRRTPTTSGVSMSYGCPSRAASASMPPTPRRQRALAGQPPGTRLRTRPPAANLTGTADRPTMSRISCTNNVRRSFGHVVHEVEGTYGTYNDAPTPLREFTFRGLVLCRTGCSY